MRLKVSRSKNAASLYFTKPFTRAKSNGPLPRKNLGLKKNCAKNPTVRTPANGPDNQGKPITFDIRQLETDTELTQKLRNSTFYKERWVKSDGLEQKLIVTFSLKYKYYQQSIRERQVQRAEKILNGNRSSLKKHHQNGCKRFIKKTGVAPDGEIAEKKVYELSQSIIDEEARYDGFYAVCTNLEDGPPMIAKINHRR